MKIYFKIGPISFLCMLGIFLNNLYSSSLVLNQPGQYVLGDNISYTPSGADQIIYITTNNVVLDLNNNIIAQSGGTGTLNGIEIATGISNVTVQNGTIQGVSGTGIYINSGCRNIVLENIQTYTAAQGIILNGTSSNSISNCKAHNITIRYTTNSALIITESSQITCNNITLDSCASTTWTVQCYTNSSKKGLFFDNLLIRKCGLGMQINNYTAALLNNCRIIKNTFAGSFKGFSVSGTGTNCIFSNCLVGSCAATGGSGNFTGFEFTSVFCNSLTNCMVNNCTGSGTAVNGFLFTSSEGTTMNNCSVSSLSSSNGSPTTNGFSFNSSNNFNINECQTLSAGQGSTQGGFSFNTCVGTTMQNLLANTTISSAHGFYFTTTATQGNQVVFANNCSAINCPGTGFSKNSTIILDTVKSCKAFSCGTGFSTIRPNLFADCIAQNCTNGFLYSPTLARQCPFIRCIAAQAITNGFFNTTTAGMFANGCIAFANGNTGFNQSVTPLGISRYFNNLSVSNSTANYSAVIPLVLVAGTTSITMGCNTSNI